MNWANILTCLRLVLIVPITALLAQGELGWALALFILAALTDFFDGRVARRFSLASEFGARLDAGVDIVLMAFIFIWGSLLEGVQVYWLLAVMAAGLGVTAAFSISLHKRIVAPHLPMGKVGTAALFIAFPAGIVFGGMVVWLSLATALMLMGRVEALVYLLKKRF